MCKLRVTQLTIKSSFFYRSSIPWTTSKLIEWLNWAWQKHSSSPLTITLIRVLFSAQYIYITLILQGLQHKHVKFNGSYSHNICCLNTHWLILSISSQFTDSLSCKFTSLIFLFLFFISYLSLNKRQMLSLNSWRKPKPMSLYNSSIG